MQWSVGLQCSGVAISMLQHPADSLATWSAESHLSHYSLREVALVYSLRLLGQLLHQYFQKPPAWRAWQLFSLVLLKAVTAPAPALPRRMWSVDGQGSGAPQAHMLGNTISPSREVPSHCRMLRSHGDLRKRLLPVRSPTMIRQLISVAGRSREAASALVVVVLLENQ